MRRSTTAHLSMMAERARALRPGPPADPTTQMGAIISKTQLEKVERYVAWGLEGGAPGLLAGYVWGNEAGPHYPGWKSRDDRSGRPRLC
jgi:acyl-CoA reductase-like NAD-dependent aldehyde dehydrogenase